MWVVKKNFVQFDRDKKYFTRNFLHIIWLDKKANYGSLLPEAYFDWSVTVGLATSSLAKHESTPAITDDAANIVTAAAAGENIQESIYPEVELIQTHGRQPILLFTNVCLLYQWSLTFVTNKTSLTVFLVAPSSLSSSLRIRDFDALLVAPAGH